jgi:5-formyltetrahydrofolate cyclo-ligase
MSHSASKEKIRQQFREARKQLSVSQQQQMNDGLLAMLRLAIKETPEIVMTFCSQPQWGEPDASLLTQYIKDAFPSAQIAYPKIIDEEGKMEAIIPTSDSKMIPGKWNIPEPENGSILDPTRLDWVLVPLLAFDQSGHRVGYGKGYYDRFLQRCRPNVIKLGISFFDPIDRIEDTGYFDVPLSRCITPGRLYEF